MPLYSSMDKLEVVKHTPCWVNHMMLASSFSHSSPSSIKSSRTWIKHMFCVVHILRSTMNKYLIYWNQHPDSGRLYKLVRTPRRNSSSKALLNNRYPQFQKSWKCCSVAKSIGIMLKLPWITIVHDPMPYSDCRCNPLLIISLGITGGNNHNENYKPWNKLNNQSNSSSQMRSN